MPTEHEFKYVISKDILVEFSEGTLASMAEKVYLIQQGYLYFSKGMSCRIRSITECDTDKKVKWYMTFKQKVGGRVIEIEKKISARDGKDLWAVAINKLKKTRCVYSHEENEWELDLLETDSGVYFIVAEVELDEGALRPKSMPLFLRRYLKLEVDLDDDRFANKRLGDIEYAKSLYTSLI